MFGFKKEKKENSHSDFLEYIANGYEPKKVEEYEFDNFNLIIAPKGVSREKISIEQESDEIRFLNDLRSSLWLKEQMGVEGVSETVKKLNERVNLLIKRRKENV